MYSWIINIPLWYKDTNELKGVHFEADETFVTLEVVKC